MRNIIRFGDLVRSSGRPETYALWSGNPKNDRQFQKAIREDRLLTIVQEPASTRKPVGQIGYHPKEHASYFVFPRPLPKDAQSRVIGINFDLLDEPLVRSSATQRKTSPTRLSASKPAPPKSFAVKLRRSATTEQTIAVTAADQRSAKHEALQKIRNEPMDIDPEEVRDKVLKIDPI